MGESAFIPRMISNTEIPIKSELVCVQEYNLIMLVSQWGNEGVSGEFTISIVERAVAELDRTFTG